LFYLLLSLSLSLTLSFTHPTTLRHHHITFILLLSPSLPPFHLRIFKLISRGQLFMSLLLAASIFYYKIKTITREISFWKHKQTIERREIMLWNYKQTVERREIKWKGGR
jgi:hypothetical protein